MVQHSFCSVDTSMVQHSFCSVDTSRCSSGPCGIKAQASVWYRHVEVKLRPVRRRHVRVQNRLLHCKSWTHENGICKSNREPKNHSLREGVMSVLAWPATTASACVITEIYIFGHIFKFHKKTGPDAKANSNNISLLRITVCKLDVQV